MDYHNDHSALTCSQLKTFLRSPVEFELQFIKQLLRPTPSKSMIVGTVCHAVLLEGRSLRESFLVYPDSCLRNDGGINPKPAADFRSQHPNAIGFGKQAEFSTIQETLLAVAESPLQPAIEAAAACEEVVYGEWSGRRIKCKPDFHCHDIVYDLKFFGDVSEAGIRRNFRRFQYWLQDSHYSACFQFENVFRFWAVETSFPYRVKSVIYDLRSREIAREAWQHAMTRFIDCERRNDWSEPTELTMTLSPWDVGANSEGDLVEIGDAE